MIYLIIFAAAIYVVLRSPSAKGYFGELGIRVGLKFLDKGEYRIINNVMIPSGDGKFAQIDHIIVSIYGVFVIETKNYKGWIFGSEDGQNWTQVIYETKNKFYNPILQNKGHIKALKTLLVDFPNLIFIPIVTFTLNADFKDLNVTSHVVYSSHLLKIIRGYTDINISINDLDKITQSILDANNTKKIAKKEHISRIKRNQANNAKAERGECPWCGGRVIERNGKYGRYTGCSNFPKCRFIFKRR